jgi:hypothetical protein
MGKNTARPASAKASTGHSTAHRPSRSQARDQTASRARFSLPNRHVTECGRHRARQRSATAAMPMPNSRHSVANRCRTGTRSSRARIRIRPRTTTGSLVRPGPVAGVRGPGPGKNGPTGKGHCPRTCPRRGRRRGPVPGRYRAATDPGTSPSSKAGLPATAHSGRQKAAESAGPGAGCTRRPGRGLWPGAVGTWQDAAPPDPTGTDTALHHGRVDPEAGARVRDPGRTAPPAGTQPQN